jgi:hypothetical protein
MGSRDFYSNGHGARNGWSATVVLGTLTTIRISLQAKEKDYIGAPKAVLQYERRIHFYPFSSGNIPTGTANVCNRERHYLLF